VTMTLVTCELAKTTLERA